ncbi:YdcF family protein [Herbaspirillum lusitanum]|uniref:YdcF family protein n=1 Tax=Herbaspirillum lusitanum TaxID=213312 RepID=A0ABW9AE97_9BURK
MNSSVLLSQFAGAALLPPMNFVLLCALGLLLRRRWPKLGTSLCWLSLALLLVLSTRVGSLWLVRPLETSHAPLTGSAAEISQGAQAIVVLGGGRLSNAPEFGSSDQPSAATLARLEYAAYLHRATGLPLLVTGGKPDGSRESEAGLMARSLQRDFEVKARWIEGESDNTQQNAVMSAAMLKPAGISKVLLLTDAMHMERSMKAFGQTELAAVAAPTGFISYQRSLSTDYLPNAGALALSSYAMHEWIGLLWYRLRY